MIVDCAHYVDGQRQARAPISVEEAAACARGERAIYFAFEESPSQIMRNMESIGLHLQPWIEAGLLQIQANRPTLHGLETHLATMHKLLRVHKPQVVVIEPDAHTLATQVRCDPLRPPLAVHQPDDEVDPRPQLEFEGPPIRTGRLPRPRAWPNRDRGRRRRGGGPILGDRRR